MQLQALFIAIDAPPDLSLKVFEYLKDTASNVRNKDGSCGTKKSTPHQISSVHLILDKTSQKL